jgi:site-specific recombinase XerD
LTLSLTLFVAAHAFVTWKNDHCGEEPRQLCSNDVDRFLIDRAAAGELCHGNRRALRRLEMHLLEAGALSRPPEPHDPIGDVVAQYATHLRRRGYADQSIASHIWFGRRFLRTMWNERSGTSWLTHDDLRNYLTNQFEDLSSATAKVMCSRLRGLLRFLASADLANSDLDLAIPRVRNLRHASLPSFMTPSQLDQVLAACNRSTTAGRRDYAILLLLARLGLRAGEAALIALDDIDWRAGLLRVKGKGGQIASIPLPHDVGEAISDYILRGRPLSGSRTIFHRVETPYTPFRSASMVSLIAGRALRRAGITGLRSRYAHVFRHTFATIAIRSGASLTELGQVLGHKDPNTTRIYAKVDIEGLRSLSRAWMGAAL